jgi:hypothetical protein
VSLANPANLWEDWRPDARALKGRGEPRRGTQDSLFGKGRYIEVISKCLSRSLWRFLRSRSTSAEKCTTPQPIKAVSEAISRAQRLWFRGGIRWQMETSVEHSTYRPFCLPFSPSSPPSFPFLLASAVPLFSWTFDAVLHRLSWQRGPFGTRVKQALALYGIVSGRSLLAKMRARSHSMTSRPGY